MKFLIVDTETTGNDMNAAICEIAATLYKVGKSEPETGAIATISTLLPVNDNSAESINNICSELTLASQQFFDETAIVLKKMAATSDKALAFNASFDAPLVNQLIGEQLRLSAMQDFDWGYPNKNVYGGFKLIDLALWLGIGVSFNHRAADDVRLLVECLNRRRSMLPEMLILAIARAKSPVVELRALVNYSDRRLASRAGFEWDDKRRIWVKKIKDCDKYNFVESLSFQCEFTQII